MEWWGILLIVLGVILILVIAIVGWYISKANWFRRTKVKIDEAASGIDVALTKRFDLLTKQFNIVKGYAKHEETTLENVIGMRSGINNTKNADGSVNMQQVSAANAECDKMQKNINVVVERYPDLKANTMFIGLQNSCTEVEEQLSATRRIYNSNVSIYNQMQVAFPGSFVARRLNLVPADFFKAEEAKREDVRMDF